MTQEAREPQEEGENERLTDEVLTRAEDVLRDHGFAYPFCWAMWFLSAHRDELIRGLLAIGAHDQALHLTDLINEIETGIGK